MTPKQAAFVQEYMTDLNATQAAIRAGYSVKTAGSFGHDLLKKPEIQAAIAEAQASRAARTEITADRVLDGFAAIAFSDDGETKDGDRLKALELIGKHLGMFTNKHDHTSSDGSMTPSVIERVIVRPESKADE